MKTVGRFGGYSVSEDFESKKFFVKIIEDGVEKSIPIRRVKRYLQLSHDSGVVVCFSIYMHQGVIRYKDSRLPKKSFITPDECAAEISRMLGLPNDSAIGLLSLYPSR